MAIWSVVVRVFLLDVETRYTILYCYERVWIDTNTAAPA